MRHFQGYRQLFSANFKNLNLKYPLFNRYHSLFLRNRCFLSGQNRQTNVKNQDIWKKLKIGIMKSQLEIQDLCKNNQNQLDKKFHFEKGKLIQTLKKIQSDILTNEQLIKDQLLHFQTNPHMLSQEIETMYKAVEKHDYQSKNAYIYTHYYQSFNNFVMKAEKHSHLTRLALILETFIKFKHLLKVNQVDSNANILNSCPSIYYDVWGKIKIINFDEEKIDRDYLRLRIAMHTIIGILQDINIFNQSLLRSFAQMPFKFAYGLLNYRKKILKSYRFFNNPNASAIQFLNHMDQGHLGKLLQLSLPNIKTNKMIYIPSRGNFENNVDIFKPNESSIPVRVLYNKSLPQSSSDQLIEQAFIHMHGGGLILFTSFITQNQTRLWANQTGIPIFSIDYKLAPKHPFPEAVYDCLQVYRFLTEEIHKYLNIRLKRTFVGGDSAGGNLSCALMALILKNKLLIPKGIFLIYPSLDLRKTIYYPSRQYTLIDPIIWPSLAVLVIDSYIKHKESADNPLISPLLLTEEFISGKEGDKAFPKQWPRTIIIVGLKDPLRDECLLLMERMTKSGIDCECRILQGFRHGFMNTQKFIRQSQVPFKMSVQIVKNLIEKARKE